METSSPLAAMQHSTAFLRGCGFQAECPTSYPTLASSQQFGQNNFNFRDLSMTKSQSDYFSMRPVRGSSPTTSLAADLSQNFHIDQRYVRHTKAAHAFSQDLVPSSPLREEPCSFDKVYEVSSISL